MAKGTKIVLGKRPKNFKKEVSCKMLDGSAGCMEVTYKYRTRKELAELTDDLQARLKDEANAEIERFKAAMEKAKADGEKIPEFTLTQTEIVNRQSAITVEYILAIVEEWNLDAPFDKDGVTELVDTLPAMVEALKDDYRAAINEGRLGNSV
ncbi:phage tail assembly chaperone [Massilia sp. DD77]|uniref:phage tail assembly chaperone n=1 Tax=Massilia sp. DD77 TaxID=3109349 RepID=UPI002FFEE278